MPTQKKNPDPKREDPRDAAFGGFERRLSYDRIVKKIERKKHRRQEGAEPEAATPQEPPRKKGLAILLSLLALGAATVLAIGLWLWLR